MRFVVLGTAQDGGVPHIGCRCRTCTAAREGRIPARSAASAAIVDPEGGRAWLIDASPDLPRQLEMVRDAVGDRSSGIPLSGILLTHIHMGHYWGLGHLGKEGMMPRGLPLFAPPGAASFLRENRPFRDMVSWGVIDVRPVRPGDELPLVDGLTLRSLPVPHREDFSDTVAWVVEGPRETLVYAPDMDHMGAAFVDLVEAVDMAFVDGTFFRRDEIPGAMGTVPHPPVEESVVRLQRARDGGTRVAFTHLNHTNPLCDPRSHEFEQLVCEGYGVVMDGYAVDI